jgi:hypothetical protein
VLNPALDNDEWKNARIAEIGIDSFLQEYGAEFVVGGGQFFDLREIDFENRPAAPGDGVNWVAGFDPAFHGDHFGVALVGVSRSEPGVLLVGVVDGIKPSATKRRGLGPRRAREDATLEKVLELIAPYEPRIVSDQHQPDAIRAFFGRQGMSVQIVNLRGPAQTAAFTSMRARLMDGSLRLWDHPQLVEELRRVRARESSEAIVLPHFGGSHCDVASALCLATWSHRGVTDTPGWVPGPQVYKPVMSGLMGQSGAGERWVDPDRRVQGGGESIMNKRF